MHLADVLVKIEPSDVMDSRNLRQAEETASRAMHSQPDQSNADSLAVCAQDQGARRDQ